MRNVLVTGASRGIGLGIARVLAGEGYRVIGLARKSSEALEAAIEASRSQGAGEIAFASFDLERIEDVPILMRGLQTVHGPLYGLVNNAGIGTEGLLANMPVAAIERLVRLNTLAPIIVAKHAVRSMMSAGEGRIVNMASIIASTGYGGLSVYAATKASLIGFTRSLAREVGPLAVTVNAVAPGFVETDMTGAMDAAAIARIANRSALKRLAQIEDVAHAVAYLMGETARNVTGTVMTVDAGNTA